MEYIGEFLLPGQLGHFFAVLSLVASLLATYAYFTALKALPNGSKSWLFIARVAFAAETIAVVGLFVCLYFIISQHLFEYKYAWQHSSRSLQFKYLLSCFWEGQEGSFMLWSFWHCVLGWVIIARSGRWEAPVMGIVGLVQTALATMLLGIYFGSIKVGSSPFVLLRNEMDAPIFSKPDYLNFIKDGNGLNALLQNYWMVIHPPILFLGFAATTIPFAFALAGIITRLHKDWITPALPWALFAAAVLGTGIMMGGAWAYESLTFGGYWAWDPVENASLVPWLLLISGIHTHLIFKHSGYSLRSTYLFYILSFILVLYSTFLTRSGILGDTSVHAFTDLGMNGQLFLFLNAFIWLSPFLIIRNNLGRWGLLGAFIVTNILGYYYPVAAFISAIGGLVVLMILVNKDKSIPTIQREEALYSREFWMFIASLLFFLSAAIIIGKTSIPVVNKLFGTEMAPPADVEFSHNSIQVWVAILTGLLTAVTQFFRYKETPKPLFWKSVVVPFIVALALSLSISFLLGIAYQKQGLGFWFTLHIAVFAATYAVVGNAAYLWKGVKGKLALSGASIAHIGYGLFLLGILLSSGNKKVLSINTTGISPLKATDKENSYENTTLIKGIRTDMGKYHVTYTRDTVNGLDSKKYFEILFAEKNGTDSFALYPDVIENNKGGSGLTPNPDAKHYLTKDIFTYVTFLSDPDAKRKDTTSFRNQMVVVGDTNFYSNGMWVVNQLVVNPQDGKFAQYAGDTILAADISVIVKDGRQYKAMPAFRLKGLQIDPIQDTVMSQSLVFSLIKPGNLNKKEVEIAIKESNALLEFITLKVYDFPFINVLWLGVVIMVIGFLISMVRRIQLIQRSKTK